MAKDFEELLIWKKALEFWEAVNSLLDGRVCQVVEKCERVIIRHVTAVR